MESRYRVIQDAIKDLDDRPLTDPAVLAWALARVVDRRVWEVRVARWGVCLYPREIPPSEEVFL